MHDESTISRRDFIKTTASGVVAATAVIGTGRGATADTVRATRRVIGANDRIRVAVIGVKGMGGGHLRNLVGPEMQGDNVEVIAVCDIWETIRQRAQKTAQLPDAGVYTDYRKLLDNKDVDAVVVATPDHWHGRIGVDALLAGKHLYIEKPMTRKLDEAFKIYDIAKETGLRVQVGSQGCSDPKYLKARDLATSGRFGTLLWAQGSYCRNNPQGEWNYKIEQELTPQTIDWKTWLGNAPKHEFSPERFFRWRKYWDYGTGIIGDLWPHRLHPLMLAMGVKEFPKSVACIGADMCRADAQLGPDGQPFGAPRDVPDTTLMMVEFPSGVSIILAGSTVNERGIEDVIRFSKANFTMGGNRLMVSPERPFTDEIEAKDETPVDAGETHVKHMRNFLESIRKNAAANCNEDLAIRVQTVVSMCEAAYRKRGLAKFDERKREITV